MKTSLLRSLMLLLALGFVLGASSCKMTTPNDPTANNLPNDPGDPSQDPGSSVRDDDPSDDPGTPTGLDPRSARLGVIPKTFGSMVIPSSNPMTQAKIELGRHLFYDKRMSTTKQVSCGSCHEPSKGFADNVSVSPGISGRLGNLNAQSLVNLGHYEDYGWNGRFKSLEEHAPGPIFNTVELGFGRDPNLAQYYGDPDSDTIILFRNLGEEPKYPKLFKDAFGTETITIQRIAQAIASFERTFVSNTSPFDDFNNGNKAALSLNAIRGYKLFINSTKTNCLSCHNGANFTDNKFHNNGLSVSTKNKGRAELTGNSADIGKFRTASLRNAGVTWPYMHDGSISGATPTAALEEVIRRYRAGGDGRMNQDERIRPLDLTDQDVADIAAFIKSLTDTKFMSNPALQNPWVN